MKAFLQAITMLLGDLAASLVFVILFATTHNAVLSAAVGVLIGLLRIAVQAVRREPVDAMEWLSLFLVVAASAATIVTDDPRFVLFKPSAIYAVIGFVMLRPGWINRYLPAIARTVAPDIATHVGFAWAGLMFITAGLNAYLALTLAPSTWAVAMASFGIASKVVLFLAGFSAIRLSVRRRISALPADQREALLLATGWQGVPSPADRVAAGAKTDNPTSADRPPDAAKKNR